MATTDMTREALAAVEYRGEASAELVAHDEAALARLSSWAKQAGCRIVGRALLARGEDRVDRAVSADVTLVDPGPDLGAAELWLDELESGPRAGRSVVILPRTALDDLPGLLFHPEVDILCDPAPHEWQTAIREATARPSLKLHDVSKGKGAARLQQLSAELGRVAEIVAALSEDDAVATAAGADEPEEGDGRRVDSGFIRSIIRARRLRDQFFRGEWFADPAWDMLLDLMAARLERQRVAVSSLCIAAAVPPTTALRWIKALCEQGLFIRIADPEDGRRVFIELSDDAATRLEAYLKSAHRVSPLIL